MGDGIAEELRRVMAEHPHLHIFGMGIWGNLMNYRKNPGESLPALRDELETAIPRVRKSVAWVEHNLEKQRLMNNRHDSYFLKHIAEREVDYIENGVFIAACLILGFRMSEHRPNPHFAIKEKSIATARRRVGMI